MITKRNIKKPYTEYLDTLKSTGRNMNTTTHLIAKKFSISTPDAQFVLEHWQEKQVKPAGKKKKKRRVKV